MAREKEIIDKAFEFAYNCALDDATRRVANKAVKMAMSKVRVKEAVRAYIDSIFNETINPDDIYKTINYVVSESNSDGVTLGKAQKLVNMTAKYVYIGLLQTGDNSYRNRFSVCHCPMDRKMICGVIDEYEPDKTSLKKDISWSRMSNYEVYNEFQRIVKELSSRESISPLEYDLIHWPGFNDKYK